MKIKGLLLLLVAAGILVIQAHKSVETQPKPKPKAKTAAKPAVKKPAVKVGDTITTASGLKYVLTKINPKGMKAAKGDKVEAHYTGTLTNGKKFDSSRDRNQTFSFTLGRGEVIAGWDEGFELLRQGETATLIIPPGLGYGERDMGDIPANSTLIFDVELVSIKKPIKYTPYSGKGKDTVRLKSGLKYIVIHKGNPKMKAKPEQTASIYYAGYFLNGKKFDGNFGTFEPFDLKVTGAPVIKGWQEILPLMNKGMKVRLIVPPHLGYGERGYPGAIPPNSTLIFDMLMYDLK